MQEWGNAKLKNLPSKQLLSTYWEFRPIITSLWFIVLISCKPITPADGLIGWVWPLLVFPSIPNAFLKPRGLTMDPLDSIRRLILRLPIRSFKTSVQPGWPATSLRHQHRGARDFSGLKVMSSNYWLGWCETMTKYVEISGHWSLGPAWTAPNARRALYPAVLKKNKFDDHE